MSTFNPKLFRKKYKLIWVIFYLQRNQQENCKKKQENRWERVWYHGNTCYLEFSFDDLPMEVLYWNWKPRQIVLFMEKFSADFARFQEHYFNRMRDKIIKRVYWTIEDELFHQYLKNMFSEIFHDVILHGRTRKKCFTTKKKLVEALMHLERTIGQKVLTILVQK